jgi:gag-polyprotein putative aspartyl protease
MALPLAIPAINRLTVAASVDLYPLRAILDTGATASLITRPNALRAGVTAAMLEEDPLVAGSGIGTARFAMRRHVFGEMQVGLQHFRPAPLVVGGTNLGGAGMLLGLDYLGSRRVWVSYRLRRLFIAATGSSGRLQ